MRPANIHELRHADESVDLAEFLTEKITVSVPLPMAVILGQILDAVLLKAIENAELLTDEANAKLEMVDMFSEMLYRTPFDSALVVDITGEI